MPGMRYMQSCVSLCLRPDLVSSPTARVEIESEPDLAARRAPRPDVTVSSLLGEDLLGPPGLATVRLARARLGRADRA